MRCVDVTVLGGGPVGLFACFYAGLRSMSVRLIDSLPELGGQLTALYPEKYVYDMPGFPEVLAKDLAAAMVAQGLQFGPEVVLGEMASTLEREGEALVVGTQSGGRYPTRTLIIAAGAGAFTPTRLGVEGESDFEGRGLRYAVRDKSELAGKRIVIVGGGDSACDWALALHPLAASVTLVHRRDQFRAHEHTVGLVRAAPVELRLWHVVRALHGTDRLEALTLENTQSGETSQLEVDELVVNVGFKSTLGPIRDWGVVIEKQQIVTDPLGRTSLEGVFAVGDVAAYEGKLKLIATGVGEAATAVCLAKTMIDPAAKLFPGHSSDMDLSKLGAPG